MSAVIRHVALARGWRSQHVFFVNAICVFDASAAWTLRPCAQRTPTRREPFDLSRSVRHCHFKQFAVRV